MKPTLRDLPEDVLIQIIDSINFDSVLMGSDSSYSELVQEILYDIDVNRPSPNVKWVEDYYNDMSLEDLKSMTINIINHQKRSLSLIETFLDGLK